MRDCQVLHLSAGKSSRGPMDRSESPSSRSLSTVTQPYDGLWLSRTWMSAEPPSGTTTSAGETMTLGVELTVGVGVGTASGLLRPLYRNSGGPPSPWAARRVAAAPAHLPERRRRPSGRAGRRE
ncbi:hypothetical protein ACQP2K_09665 [Microbispora siamensis]